MRIPKVISEPTVEPISLEEARLHLRLDAYDSPAVHPDDDLVSALITAAREWAEGFTRRSIAVKTLELALDRFPCRSDEVIELPEGPVQAVISFAYIDGSNVQQTLTAYQFDTHSAPPRLAPEVDSDWPETRDQLNAVRIRYVAGYTLPGDSPDLYPLPKKMKQAMLLLVAHWYENREDSGVVKLEQIPLGAEALLRSFRLHNGMA